MVGQICDFSLDKGQDAINFLHVEILLRGGVLNGLLSMDKMQSCPTFRR